MCMVTGAGERSQQMGAEVRAERHATAARASAGGYYQVTTEHLTSLSLVRCFARTRRWGVPTRCLMQGLESMP